MIIEYGGSAEIRKQARYRASSSKGQDAGHDISEIVHKDAGIL